MPVLPFASLRRCLDRGPVSTLLSEAQRADVWTLWDDLRFIIGWEPLLHRCGEEGLSWVGRGCWAGGGWAGRLHLRGGAWCASSEYHKVRSEAPPGRAAQARALPRLPRTRLLRAGWRLDVVEGSGVANRGGRRVPHRPRRSGGSGR